MVQLCTQVAPSLKTRRDLCSISEGRLASSGTQQSEHEAETAAILLLQLR